MEPDDLQLRHIAALPPEVRKVITAGQVIHSPFNICKELLENSLDSGATNITIILEDGGYRKVIVKDNGCGFHTEDKDLIARQSFSSKVRNVSDAKSIVSFGFRGEALSAMASSGQVIITSKRREAERGLHLKICGEKRTVIEEDNIDNGTEIVVTDVFGVPTKSTIQNSIITISKLVKHYALLRRNYSILLNASNVTWRSPSVEFQTVGEWISAVYNVKFEAAELVVSDEVFVNVYYGLIDDNKKNEYIYFVNKRLIKYDELTKELEVFVSSFKQNSCFMTFIFDINMPPSYVDVHVNAQKSVVHMVESRKVFAAIMDHFNDHFELFLEEKQLLPPKLKKDPRLNDTLNISFMDDSFGSFCPRTSVDPATKIRADAFQRSICSFLKHMSTDAAPEPTNNRSGEEVAEGEGGSARGPAIRNIPMRQQKVFDEFNFIDKLPEYLMNPDELRIIQTPLVNYIKNISQKHVDRVRQAANLKLSVFNGECYVFFQYSNSFNVVPFANVLHECIVQTLIEKLGNLKMVGNSGDEVYTFSMLSGKERPELKHSFWLNVRSAADTLLKLFSLAFYHQSDGELEIRAVPYIFSSIAVPWEVYFSVAAVTPFLVVKNTHPVILRQWVWKTANHIAFYITSYLIKDPHFIDTWNETKLRDLFSQYLPGDLFEQSLTEGTTKDLFKIFERC